MTFVGLKSASKSHTEALARLDERLARSPVRDGLIERQHFADAAAALWLEGELVHLEDLVLHDAHMDIRTPTHELTRAHAVLRTRRRILSQKPDWALSREGLREVTGRGHAVTAAAGVSRGGKGAAISTDQADFRDDAEDDLLAEEFAEIDAVLARSSKILSGVDVPVKAPRPDERPDLIYDLDWDEDARLAEWQDVIAETRDLPVVLRAALLLDAWSNIELLQHGIWFGPLLVAALLRQEGTTANHLMGFQAGAKKVPRERRRARDKNVRLLAGIETITEAASTGLKEHDRLVLARGQLERRLRSRRANSKLPKLVELVLARPLVSTAMIRRN